MKKIVFATNKDLDWKMVAMMELSEVTNEAATILRMTSFVPLLSMALGGYTSRAYSDLHFQTLIKRVSE
ncbi:hypothetical protein [Paenibacillus alginolyticus]|uniref:Uncharacterized protein n=1 Tax=Paenibacillus alginolyticus TaxID=59839 RepID=A0ABT4GAI3_9BACL|nr:hypothetical protein [Paenibacillus alginolyticus]MCY9693202.1 hypothetical protein [Paenibacillus alginolyticus]MEC0146029.1 hypothetical protein [Paenibacillus alginolyticus]